MSKITGGKGMKFSSWIYLFKRIGIAHGFFLENIKLYEEGFKPYFEDGLTPFQAWRQEVGQLPIIPNRNYKF